MAAGAAAAADGAAPKLNVDPLAGNPNEGAAAAAAGAAAGAAAPKVKAVPPAGLPNEKLIFPILFLQYFSKSKAPNLICGHVNDGYLSSNNMTAERCEGFTGFIQNGGRI